MSQTLARAELELPPSTATRSTQHPDLKRRLMLIDVAAASVGWGIVLGVAPRVTGAGPPYGGRLPWAAGAAIVTVLLVGMHNLYLARVCSVRAVELQGLGRSALGAALAVVCVEELLATQLPLREVWVAAFAAFTLLASGRAAYASWLRHQRTRGRFVRDVILVGADGDAVELAAVAREHPESGFRVCGYVGASGHDRVIGAPHLGGVDDVVQALGRTGATGVVVIASALAPDVLNTVVRGLLDRKVNVQLSSGLRGIAQQRFRPTPLAHEPLFYIEPASLTPWQLWLKRAIDIVGAVAGLVITAPVLAVAAVAIRIDSSGPVLFRQRRIGRHGEPFVFYKLRTMVVDAEADRARLEARNQRVAGPLFKLATDPRTTRIGRLLRATSIDELPQLWNVLRGSMSLVGPRPALPNEVRQFDAELRTRATVAPGLTGLWQIEARDNPAFGPYRRLDLFYVENWSPLLDLGILTATAWRVITRAVHLLGADETTDQIVLD